MAGRPLMVVMEEFGEPLPQVLLVARG